MIVNFFSMCILLFLYPRLLWRGGSGLGTVVEYLELLNLMLHWGKYQFRSGFQMELIMVEPWLWVSLEGIEMMSEKMGESQRIYKSCGDHLILLIKYHHGNSV
jgi:hypothetical protein